MDNSGLQQLFGTLFSGAEVSVKAQFTEMVVSASNLHQVAQTLRNHPECRFDFCFAKRVLTLQMYWVLFIICGQRCMDIVVWLRYRSIAGTML